MHIADSLQCATGIALVATTLLATTVQAGRSGFDKIYRQHHVHHHRRHLAMDSVSSADLTNNETLPAQFEKRTGQCVFPYASGMVAVTPDSDNAGWAMSPDQSCTPGSYCPYACEPGHLSMQWDTAATSYTYPESQYGGLYCGEDGTMSKPYPDRDYCVAGVGSVSAYNTMGSEVAFCQTVLPGNEAMLIATNVGAGSTEVLAVPDTSYWAETAAHYYINPAGVSTTEGCVWGTDANPWGNWAPFVAGANTDSNGNTFVKIGWNPIYTDDSTWNSVVPTWAVKIECVGSGCNGTPCRCDPLLDGMNMCSSGTTGAGDAAFCVVTVPSGGSANIVVYDTSGSSSSSSSAPSSSAAEEWSSSSSYEAAPTSSAVNIKALQVVPQTTAYSSSAEPTTPSYQDTYSTSTSETPVYSSSTPEYSPSATSTWSPAATSSSSVVIESTSSLTTTSAVISSYITPSATVLASSTYTVNNISTLTTSSSVVTSSLASFRNTTSTIAKSSTTAVVLGAYGYQNLQAAAVTSAHSSASASSSTKKSGSPDLLKMSPLLAFLSAVVILSRL